MTRKQTTIKTVGYRAISWASTTILAWLLIGQHIMSTDMQGTSVAELTFIFSVVDMVMNTVLYFLYERAWVRHQQRKA